METNAGLHEIGAVKSGIHIPNNNDIGVHGFGYIIARNEYGKITYESPFDNLIVNTGLNFILSGTLLQSATLYLAPMGVDTSIGTSGISTVSSAASGSTSLTLSASTSWAQYQNVTVLAAAVSGANLAAYATALGSSSTTLAISPATSTAISGGSNNIIWGPVFATTDTMTSHGTGTSEIAGSQLTSSTNRPQFSQATIGSNTYVSNTGNGTNLWTLASGATNSQWWCSFFLTTGQAIGGTSGTLISEFVPTNGAFQVGPNNTVSLTYTITLTSSSLHQ